MSPHWIMESEHSRLLQTHQLYSLPSQRISTDPKDYAFSTNSRKRLQDITANADEPRATQLGLRIRQNVGSRPDLGPPLPTSYLIMRFANFSCSVTTKRIQLADAAGATIPPTPTTQNGTVEQIKSLENDIE